jgi:CYTH domain-containing protein
MLQGHQYARLERERRFLLDRFPTDQIAVRSRRITDYYVDRTTLRLREMQDDGGPRVFKLTQKIAKRESGAQQGFITSMHLTEDEFRVLAQLPAKKLHKIRYNVPPFGVDVFKGGWKASFWPRQSSIRRLRPRASRCPLSFSMKCPMTNDSLEVNWSAPRAKISRLGCSNMGLR